MNSLNDNIYTVSGVAQDKKVRVRTLGRGAHSESTVFSHKPTVTESLSMHSLRVWGGKWGSTQYLYSSWSQTLRFLHGQLERHFTQGKRTGIGLGERAVSSRCC